MTRFTDLLGVVAHLHTRMHSTPLLVGVDGHSAAGKSTLAGALAQQLEQAMIIHGDDFYRVMNPAERAALDDQGGYERYYDWQRLAAQVLRPLRQGQFARYQRYNWPTNSLGAWVEIPPAGVIIVEGVYILRPELRDYYDVGIMVEANFAVRMQRQDQRSDPAAWVARWEAAEVYYMQQHHPHVGADLVLGV